MFPYRSIYDKNNSRLDSVQGCAIGIINISFIANNDDLD